MRTAARGADIEDIVTMCENQCRKACNLRTPAEDSDEAGHSGSSSSRARRYRKRGSPKLREEDIAMETTPSLVRLWSAAESEGHSDGYRSAPPLGLLHTEGDGQASPPGYQSAHGP